jgi:RNA polymerase-binding transcription factor DksA
MTSLKKRLEADLREAERERQDLAEQLDHKPDFGLGKGSAGADSWEMSLDRKQRVDRRIAELKEALDRVREGTYGVCQSCGGPINPERLEILPTASLCMRCAREGNGSSPTTGRAG